MNKKSGIFLLSPLSIILFTGCYSNIKYVTKNSVNHLKNIYKDDENLTENLEKIYNNNKKFKYIDLSYTRKISDILKELSLNDKKIYMLKSEDILIDSIPGSKFLKIKTLSDFNNFLEQSYGLTIYKFNIKEFELKNKISELEKEIEKYKKEIKKYENNINYYLNDTTEIKKKVKQITNEEKEYIKILNNLNKDLIKTDTKINEKMNEIQNLRKNKKIKHKIKKLMNLNKELKVLIKEKSKIKKNINLINKKLINLTKEKEKIKIKTKDYIDRINRIKLIVKNYKSLIKKKENLIDKYKRELSQIKIYNIYIKDIREKEINFDKLKVQIEGKEGILEALNRISKKINFSIIYDQDLNINSLETKNKIFKDNHVLFNGKTFNDLLNFIKKEFNVYVDIDYFNKVIYIKKYKSKIFNLYFTNLIDNVTETNNYQSYSAATGSNGNTITSTYMYSLMNNIEINIRTLLQDDPNSNVILNKETGEVIVKTTQNKMKTVENYINKINKSLIKQILLKIKIVEFVINNNYNFGLDFSYKNNKLEVKTNSVLAQLLNWSLNSGSKKSVTIGLKSNIAKYLGSYTYSKIVLNNKLSKISILNFKDYIKSRKVIQTANTTTTTTTDIEVGKISQGINLSFLCKILGDNKILVRSSISISNLNKFTVDKSSNGDTIYLPDQDVKYMPSQVIINNGEQKILGIYTSYQQVSGYTGIMPIEDFIIGGNSDKKYIKKLIIVILKANILK